MEIIENAVKEAITKLKAEYNACIEDVKGALKAALHHLESAERNIYFALRRLEEVKR